MPKHMAGMMCCCNFHILLLSHSQEPAAHSDKMPLSQSRHHWLMCLWVEDSLLATKTAIH
jgi:hypothetical protein